MFKFIITSSSLLQTLLVAALQCAPANTVKTLANAGLSDIRLVAALGDSVTSAAAAKEGGDETEFVGLNFMTGGDLGVDSVYNILKERYNNINTAGSTGSHYWKICNGYLCPPFQYRTSQDAFNAAQSGALASNLPSQVDYLTKQITKTDLKDSDIKLVSLEIGGNDAGEACLGSLISESADQYQNNLVETLHKIRKQIPNSIVNILLGWDWKQVYESSIASEGCQKVSSFTKTIQVPCMYQSDEWRKIMFERSKEYDAKIMELPKMFSNYTDIRLIIDPLMTGTVASSFPATAHDKCFHPNSDYHAKYAQGIISNLLLPFHLKSRDIDMNSTSDLSPVCPDTILA